MPWDWGKLLNTVEIFFRYGHGAVKGIKAARDELEAEKVKALQPGTTGQQAAQGLIQQAKPGAPPPPPPEVK